MTMPLRLILPAAMLLSVGLLSACVGGNNQSAGGAAAPPPPLNDVALIIDSGPAAAPGRINHAYVTVRVCAAGSQSQCANIDHVLLDTDSTGLRLFRSVLTAAGVTLGGTTDAQGQPLEECVSFGSGQVWGPVASADVALAGEIAAALPVQVIDDTNTGAAPPPACGTGGTLINGVAALGANGLLGVGVFAQDCGAGCVNAGAPLPVYFGCTSAGACTAENVALAHQVSNPVALFASDNNGVIIDLPNLINANGDTSVHGQLIFGLGTQSDNALPVTGLNVLGTDARGEFTATYNGGTTVLPAVIDSGTDSYAFSDPLIATCSSGAFIGYYCPTVAPLNRFAVNMGVGVNNAVSTVNFALADPSSFVAGAAAYADLGGGGGSSTFTWGMPFFYGRMVYVGIEQRTAGAYTGPFFAY